MATYGPGNVTFTGFTPTLANTTTGDANNNAIAGAAQFNGIGQRDSDIARMFRTAGNRKYKKLLTVLIGAAAGSSASETRAQVTARSALTYFLGGVVPIVATYIVNRNTAAADDTALTALFNRTTKPASYPTDPGGGGGGRGYW